MQSALKADFLQALKALKHTCGLELVSSYHWGARNIGSAKYTMSRSPVQGTSTCQHFSRNGYSTPVVPHKAVAEVSKIGNL